MAFVTYFLTSEMLNTPLIHLIIISVRSYVWHLNLVTLPWESCNFWQTTDEKGSGLV